MRPDEQTYMTKLIVAFRNFAKLPKICTKICNKGKFFRGGKKFTDNQKDQTSYMKINGNEISAVSFLYKKTELSRAKDHYFTIKDKFRLKEKT